MLTPGSAMAMEGYLRIGYASNPGVLAAGLPLLGDYLNSHPDGTVLKVRPPLIWQPGEADLFAAAVAESLATID